METTYLAIKYQLPAPDLLTGFPFLVGQAYSHDDDEEIADSRHSFAMVDLGEFRDTTMAQREWLNANPRVIEWSIV